MTSNQTQRFRLEAGKAPARLVPPTGETLNSIFDELEEWNEHLSEIDFDFEEPQP